MVRSLNYDEKRGNQIVPCPRDCGWSGRFKDFSTHNRECPVRHNHLTRDVKPLGQCPGCDRLHRMVPTTTEQSAALAGTDEAGQS